MDTPRRHPPGATAAVSNLGTILSIWAHPDDETYLAAGVMAAARRHGQRVVCVALSAGERGTVDAAAWPPARLGPVRRWEAAAAMAVLGVREHDVRSLPDGRFEEHAGDGRAMVARLLDDVRPDTILTFGADGVTFHPDHIAVHHWVTDAWRQRGCRGRLLYAASSVEHRTRHRDTLEEWGVYMDDQRPRGVPEADLAVHVVLDGLELDRKLAALRAMATQTADSIAALGPARYAAVNAEEGFVEAASRPVPQPARQRLMPFVP